MPSFTDEIAASLPAGIEMPLEFRLALDWLDGQGYVQRYRNHDERYGPLFPPDSNGVSTVVFRTRDPAHVLAWVRGDAVGAARLAPIIRTGGDGSYAALWRDDSGAQKIVHLCSGSGSTMLGVLTHTPLDMLRLMAIGYSELCWPDEFSKTPQQVHDENECADGPYIAPVAFRAFVEATFGVKVPARAADLVKQVPSMMDQASSDPFWNWFRIFDR